MAIHTKKIKTIVGRRTPGQLNNWERIDLNHYKSEKPIVICLSGNGAITEKSANGFCKRAEILLELLFKNSYPQGTCIADLVDIVGCSYSYKANVKIPNMTETEKKDFFHKYPTMEAYLKDYPNNITKDDTGFIEETVIDDIINNILLPLCVNENNEKLPVKTACKKLSRVTFFTWCHGAMEVYKILSKLLKKCSELDYELCDIVKMFSSIMHITYAPITKANLSPTISIDSLSDYNNIHYSEQYPDINGVEIMYEYPDEVVKRFFDNIHIFSSKLTNTSEKDINEHSVEFLDRDEEWNIKGGYVNADCVSQLMSWALCRAVENGLENFKSDKFVPKMSLLRVHEELCSIRDGFKSEELKRE